MKIDECTLENVHPHRGGETPPSVGLTSCALPEAQSTLSAKSSQTGVSTRSAHSGTALRQQRVGVVVEGLVTMVTAYVPSAFLEIVE